MSGPDPDSLVKSGEDYRKMHHAVARMTLIWADVENALTELLAQAIGDQTKQLASAILFAPSSLDARIAIVDAAFRAMMPTLRDHEQISGPWDKAVKKLSAQKDARNRVAHGSIVTIYDPSGKCHVRLTAPLYDVGRFADDTRDGQLPGLSLNELEQAIEAVDRVRAKLGTFTSVVKLWRERDVQMYPLVVRALKD